MFMLRNTRLFHIVQRFLPPGAMLINPQNPYKIPDVQIGDFDGEGISEITAVYVWYGEPYTMILKKQDQLWYKIMNTKGMEQNLKKRTLNIREIVNLYPVLISTTRGIRWGYIDDTGAFVIQPMYDWADHFQENGLAIVEQNHLSGLINRMGQYILEPKYDYITEFSEGRATVFNDRTYKMIDEEANILFETDGYLSYMQDGRAAFSTDKDENEWRYGYVDRQGNVVISPKYKSAGDFKNGRAVVEIKDGRYAIIERNGEMITVFEYAYVGDISEGYLPFKKTNERKYGYIDEKGSVVIQPQFDAVGGFKNDRAVVSMDTDYIYQYGLIDKTGRIIIPIQYNDVRQLGEDRVAVGIPIKTDMPFIGSKYAIADIDGTMLTDFIYYDVTDYDQGFASVNDGRTTFFIDQTGNKAADLPSIKGIGTMRFENDLIRANVDNRISYLNVSGNTIWKEDHTINLNNRYVVKEEKYNPNRNYLVYYPQIQGMVNEQIQKQVNNNLKKIADVDKKIDSSEELDYNYQGDFSVEFFKDHLVVIEMNGYNYPFGAAHGMPTEIYAHVDLESGQFYELKDLFKPNSNYVEVLSKMIKEQITKQGEDSPVWLDSYKGIKEDQPFFISEDTLNIYFYPYEIAPYAAGFPTFKIPFRDIMNIIDTKGDFWKSFHQIH